MAYFHTTVLDNQIKALPTVDTASGSVATFDTDMTENLVSCVCEVASGSSEINVSACGVNIWDELWELGTINANGVPIGSTTNIRNINYIPCKPSTTYRFVAPNVAFTVFFYRSESPSDYVDKISSPATFTTPSTAKFMRFAFASAYGTTYNNDISINYPLTDTQYHAYNGTTANIPFGETLSGDGTFDVLSGILTRSDDTTSQLSANYIQTLNGINNIWCDTGDTEVKYILSVGEDVNQNT